MLSNHLNQYGRWPAQDFCFGGDNFITRKVRVVSLARDTPSGPPLHPYQILSKDIHQILSNYLKQYGSTVIWLVPGKVMLHNDFQITALSNLLFCLADTEYYPSLKYHTKEFVIRLWLSALAMTVKYTTDLASSE